MKGLKPLNSAWQKADAYLVRVRKSKIAESLERQFDIRDVSLHANSLRFGLDSQGCQHALPSITGYPLSHLDQQMASSDPSHLTIFILAVS